MHLSDLQERGVPCINIQKPRNLTVTEISITSNYISTQQAFEDLLAALVISKHILEIIRTHTK